MLVTLTADQDFTGKQAAEHIVDDAHAKSLNNFVLSAAMSVWV